MIRVKEEQIVYFLALPGMLIVDRVKQDRERPQSQARLATLPRTGAKFGSRKMLESLQVGVI